jgi:hypothetical protein
MQLAMKTCHREVVLDTGGSLYLKSMRSEIYIARNNGEPWKPFLDRVNESEWMWQGFGCRVAFSRFSVSPN